MPSSSVEPPARIAVPVCAASLPFRILMSSRPPLQPACLAPSQVLSFRRQPVRLLLDDMAGPLGLFTFCTPAPPVILFFGAPPAACLPPVTRCTFLEQTIPQLWAASSKLACVAFRISA